MGKYVQINKGLNYNNKNLLEKLKELHYFDTSIAEYVQTTKKRFVKSSRIFYFK